MDNYPQEKIRLVEEVSDQSILLTNLNSQMESLRDRYILQFTEMEKAVTSMKSLVNI